MYSTCTPDSPLYMFPSQANDLGFTGMTQHGISPCLLQERLTDNEVDFTGRPELTGILARGCERAKTGKNPLYARFLGFV